MNIVCPACERISELSVFRVENDALVVTCVKCNVESRVTSQPGTAQLAMPEKSVPQEPARVLSLVRGAGAALENADPFEVPAGHCPKCVAAKIDGELTCQKCGLVYDNFDAREVAMAPELKAQVLSVWKTGWHEEKRHDSLIQRALTLGQLAPLGRVYRMQLARAPSDRSAQRGRDEILRRSVEQVRWDPSAADPVAGKFRNIVLVAISLLCFLGLAWMAAKIFKSS